MSNNKNHTISIAVTEYECLKKASEILEDLNEEWKSIEESQKTLNISDEKVKYFVAGFNLTEILTGKINIRANKKLKEHCSQCEHKKQLGL